MESKQIRYALAVAYAKSFRGAARAINVSQPSLTRAVLAIENELGVALFRRTKQGAVLTPAGREFVDGAQKIQANLDQLAKDLRSFPKTDETILRIAYHGAMIALTLPKILTEYKKYFQNEPVQLFQLDKFAQVQALLSGQVDIGFARNYPDDQKIKVESILKESLFVAVHDSDPTFANFTSCTLADLIKETIILYPSNPRPSFPDVVVSMFHNEGLALHKQLIVEDVLGGLCQVGCGGGVTIVPQSAMSLQLPNLKFLKLNAKKDSVLLQIAYKASPLRPEIMQFIKSCKHTL